MAFCSDPRFLGQWDSRSRTSGYSASTAASVPLFWKFSRDLSAVGNTAETDISSYKDYPYMSTSTIHKVAAEEGLSWAHTPQLPHTFSLVISSKISAPTRRHFLFICCKASINFLSLCTTITSYRFDSLHSTPFQQLYM